MQATPLDELRKPHPDQARIDAFSARWLRLTTESSPGTRFDPADPRAVTTSKRFKSET